MSDQEVSALSVSLLAVQKNLEAIKKSATNPFFKSKYAKIEHVLEVVKPALEAESLLLLQPCGRDALGSYVATEIRNTTGEGVSCRVYLTEVADMQKLGAAVTYARRIGLVSLLAMEQEDDDGETAVGRGALEKKIQQLEPGKAKIAFEHLNKVGNDQAGLQKLNVRVDELLKEKK
jgi:hypothetical protein